MLRREHVLAQRHRDGALREVTRGLDPPHHLVVDEPVERLGERRRGRERNARGHLIDRGRAMRTNDHRRRAIGDGPALRCGEAGRDRVVRVAAGKDVVLRLGQLDLEVLVIGDDLPQRVARAAAVPRVEELGDVLRARDLRDLDLGLLAEDGELARRLGKALEGAGGLALTGIGRAAVRGERAHRIATSIGSSVRALRDGEVDDDAEPDHEDGQRAEPDRVLLHVPSSGSCCHRGGRMLPCPKRGRVLYIETDVTQV